MLNKNRKFLKNVLMSCFLVFLFFCPLMATQAQGNITTPADYSLKTGLQQSANVSGLQSTKTFEQTIGSYLKIVFGLLASIFLILMIYAGITWMVAGGSKDSITKAKNTMINATVGLFVMLLAYSLTSYIIQKISSVV